MSGFTMGLRLRIAIALAVVLGAFILVTEVSISKVMTMSLGNAASEPAMQDALARGGKLVLFYLVLGAATALAVGSLMLWRLAVQPLQRITRAVEAVAGGDLKTRVPAEGALELLELSSAFNRMTQTLSRQREEIEEHIAQLEMSRLELAAAQDRLIRAAKLASVGTLAAGIAHEIGNPLAGLLGLLDALEFEKDEAKAGQFRRLMGNELRRIDHTIAGLLAYARPSPEPAASAPACAVEEALDHALALVRAQKTFAKVRVQTQIHHHGHAAAISKDDLTQLFVNLLLNSAQAMDGQGEILVETADSGDSVRLTVQDSGPGVRAEYVSKVFDPFFTTKPLGKGTGLGLAICQSICERSGGDLALDGGYKDGARFVATLPLAQVATKQPPV
jgi:signal transduction histidine kinase